VVEGALADQYESFYREFASPLMRQLRLEAYGEDIGQHSWVGADELRRDAQRLGLSASSRLLDLGSGPCGPLTFLLSTVGCTGVGLELSPSAIQVGYLRATALGVQERFSAHATDLNDPLPFGLGAFDAVLAVDVVLHLRDRQALFREVTKLLRPGGRFLFTDAGVISGAVSNDELQRRSVHGYTQFVPIGWNERLLDTVGLRVLETENRTASVFRNANGRLAALRNHREELERLSGVASFQSQNEYLTTVAELARRGAVSRIMYLTEVRSPSAG
jgi:cyclopropane fatty-acyl-phospholipid synthase-like methyltransferase